MSRIRVVVFATLTGQLALTARTRAPLCEQICIALRRARRPDAAETRATA
jgi:hypothetical protein